MQTNQKNQGFQTPFNSIQYEHAQQVVPILHGCNLQMSFTKINFLRTTSNHTTDDNHIVSAKLHLLSWSVNCSLLMKINASKILWCLENRFWNIKGKGFLNILLEKHIWQVLSSEFAGSIDNAKSKGSLSRLKEYELQEKIMISSHLFAYFNPRKLFLFMIQSDFKLQLYFSSA